MRGEIKHNNNNIMSDDGRVEEERRQGIRESGKGNHVSEEGIDGSVKKRKKLECERREEEWKIKLMRGKE